MKFSRMLHIAGFVALITAGTASATTVSVNAQSGPWDQNVTGNASYGVGDNLAPTVLGVTPGSNVTINYVSGSTNEFNNGSTTSVDGNGYTSLSYGSGTGFTGVGSSGTRFPSYTIDPTNTGEPIYLGELIGDFVNSSGVVLAAFAVGNSFSFVAPAGSTALQLGLNDDIFKDNSGSLTVNVTGVSAVPLPAALPLFGAAIAGLTGFSLRRRAARTV